MNDWWVQLLRLLTLEDANVRWVLGGMTLLGLTAGVLGSFTLLRKRALIGDALAHTALPGIAIAFILTGTKSTIPLLIGAYVAGVLGVFSILAIRKWSRIKDDSALSIVLTAFFGVGVILLTYIQKSGASAQSGLDKFLFGQSAAMLLEDVVLIGAVALLMVLAVVLLFKEFKLLCFDSDYTTTIGFSAGLLDALLMGLIVGSVVIGLQVVGVVLTAALLIIPPTAARFWTDRLERMVLISGVIGAVTGALGAIISFLVPRSPSGPLTVVAGGAVFLISVLVAPERGVISRLYRQLRLKRKTNEENFLRAVGEYAEEQGKLISESLVCSDLAVFRRWSMQYVKKELARATKLGLATRLSGDKLLLTQEGVQRTVALIRRHRLWEVYLMNQAQIPSDHVDRDADESEHFLTPAMIARLEELAGLSGIELPESPHPVATEGTNG